jgi:hypothetical protein
MDNLVTDNHISRLYPELSGLELKQAEENIQAYLALVLRIYQRLEQEQYSQSLGQRLSQPGSQPG